MDLSEAAEQVPTATVETHVFDIPVPYTMRRSSVGAVVDSVRVRASCGDPDDPGQLPVLAERAAAERAAGTSILWSRALELSAGTTGVLLRARAVFRHRGNQCTI